MPLTTPCVGLPFPTNNDPIDVAGDIGRLALAVDSAICSTQGKHIGEITAYWDAQPTSPPPSGTLRMNGAAFSASEFPELAAYLGGTVVPDLRGSFLRGTGGAFPANGQQGGFNEATLVEHEHSLNGHQHSIDHDHGVRSIGGGDHAHTITHDHAPTGTTGVGNHAHGFGPEPLIYSTPNGFSGQAGGGLNYTSPINWNGDGGAHSHTSYTPTHSGWSSTNGHSHNVSVPALSGSTSGPNNGNTARVGQPAANRNLPPFTNVTYLIQAVPTTN